MDYDFWQHELSKYRSFWAGIGGYQVLGSVFVVWHIMGFRGWGLERGDKCDLHRQRFCGCSVGILKERFQSVDTKSITGPVFGGVPVIRTPVQGAGASRETPGDT